MSTIQIRIDNDIKEKARSVFATLGMDMTAGISLFLHQVVIRQGMPMNLLTPNQFTIEQEKEILQAAEEAERGINVTKSMSADEALAYLEAL